MHACPVCYPNMKDDDCVLFSKNGASSCLSRRIQDLKKKEWSIKNNIPLTIYWTHDVEKNDFIQERIKYYKQRGKKKSINHREALYGGRTLATSTFFSVEGTNDTIHYWDINGLYPHVLMTKRFPTSHPYSIRDFPPRFSKDDDWTSFFMRQDYFGLIHCKIKAPSNLLHPVLPFRVNGKLMFPLCMFCAIESRKENCNHGNILEGVWFTGEVVLAIENGYIIEKIYQVEHYPSSTCGEKNPFSAFITDCMREKEKAQQENNPGKRTISKLIGNSMWGRLALQSDGIETAYASNETELFQFLASPQYKVSQIIMMGEKLIIKYKKIEAFKGTPNSTSLVSASMVTSYARMELYKYMKRIPDNDLLYVDTDSLLFKSNHHYPHFLVDIGAKTGQIDNELRDDEKIIAFCSSGPKSYMLKIIKNGEEKLVAKLKGLNVKGMNLYPFFEFIKENYSTNCLVAPLKIQENGIRTNYFHQVSSIYFEKKFGNSFDKAIIRKHSVYPWGYKDDDT